jgi:hypothetical protein
MEKIMGKSKRKINKLKRKLMESKVKPRIPVAPPSISMKSKKDYNRHEGKKQLKKLLENRNG